MREVPESDCELIEGLRAGREDAFRELYSRLQGQIYRFALHMSGSRSLAEDVVQETFLILFNNSGRYDTSKGSVANFVLGITRNCLLRRLRHERTFLSKTLNICTKEGTEPIADSDPHDELSRSETVRHVRSAVLTLPVRYREVIVLCELQDRSYEDAAALLGCRCGTVRSRLHRARALLLEKLRAMNLGPELSKVKSRRCLA